MLLAALVIGSGIAAQQLSPGQIGLQLVENAAATAAGLYAIILMVGPVSGAHFNPVVTAVDAAFGGLPWRDAAAYLPAQIAGCVAGAVLANLMFGRSAVSISTHHRASGPHLLAEVVATAGLALLIFALVRSERGERAPAAVGAYIGAAYWFTSSTSFANPAISVGRMFSDTFAGIAPASVPAFIAVQAAGGLVGYGLVRLFYPPTPTAPEQAPWPHPGREPHLAKGPAPVSEKPSVLFVCVHNAGRSQMAAGWLNHLAAGRIEVRSAGSMPADQINPTAVTAMTEVGIDITAETPKILTVEAVQASDVVITMGCGDTCPIFPGRRYEDWKLDDPAGQGIDAVRPIRDDIRARVEKLIGELLPAGT
ncbi:aquaporin [Frankia sp. AiPa1]|uniref:arsenate reductase/protein-tyrosine-phosphatase family protein n=1 Tax=Frankia sp. AiPa1 TaxID=573492 RepID=UPI0035A915A2